MSMSSGTLDCILYAISYCEIRVTNLGIAHGIEMELIERLDLVDRSPALLSAHSGGIRQEEHRIARRSQLHTLVDCWQEGAAP